MAMPLRSLASVDAQGPSLCMPAEWDALPESLELQVRRLGPLQDGLDDIGGEESEPQDAADISLGHALVSRYCRDRRCLAGEELPFPGMGADERLD